jgi:hypothetical protein
MTIGSGEIEQLDPVCSIAVLFNGQDIHHGKGLSIRSFLRRDIVSDCGVTGGGNPRPLTAIISVPGEVGSQDNLIQPLELIGVNIVVDLAGW